MYANASEFGAYGRVLRGIGPENQELFHRTGNAGWRVAEVPVFDREILSMSLHDNTPEAFFPVEGRTALAVANKDDFSDCRLFLLDQPMMIRAGVWHGLMAVTEESRILVGEDAEVHLEKKPFGKGEEG